jgi:transposase
VASERDNDAHRAYRAQFRAAIARVRPHQLVFLDESYCKTGMRRDRGWARKGERSISFRPFRRWKTLSLVGAIRLGAHPRLMTHDGAVNGPIFLRFIRRYVVPWLCPGDVVVMDNLNFHKMLAVRAAIEAVGAEALYLPTYSPELNPIELWWADLKRHLRKRAADSADALVSTVRRLRRALPLAKITSWFRHAHPANHIN